MSNASSFGRQFDGDERYPVSFDFEYEDRSFKKPTDPSTLPNTRAQVVNEARVRYFKTQLCRRYIQGKCTRGSDCSFAHCEEELRRQEFGNDARTFKEPRLCRMFYQGQECSYGTACRFLHIRPSNVNSSRDTAAVEVIPRGNGKRIYDQLEFKSEFDESSDAKVNPKREMLKTKLCIEWEMKGHCPNGHMCRLAHGQAELGKLDGSSTSAATTNLSSGAASTGNLLKKPRESLARNYKFSRMELHRISRIYADWI